MKSTPVLAMNRGENSTNLKEEKEIKSFSFFIEISPLPTFCLKHRVTAYSLDKKSSHPRINERELQGFLRKWFRKKEKSHSLT